MLLRSPEGHTFDSDEMDAIIEGRTKFVDAAAHWLAVSEALELIAASRVHRPIDDRDIDFLEGHYTEFDPELHGIR